MSEMICITCPIGCHLQIERVSETEIVVTGNKCARGEHYAKEEILSPRRVVTATCRAEPAGGESGGPAAAPAGSLYAPRRVPVRTVKAFPRERIPELLELIYAIDVKVPVERGRVVIANALDTGIDVIVTRSM